MLAIRNHLHTHSMKTPPKKAIFIRLRQDTLDMLDRACKAQTRSRSMMVDVILQETLTRQYADLSARLNSLVGAQQ